jgi:tryptophan 2,3-dioxygenase
MSDSAVERLTYGAYLRVPELLSLQTPVQTPPVQGEMLFIIGQQTQELWFKQILFDLRHVIDLATGGEIVSAARLLDRANQILAVLSAETQVMETLPPIEFRAFRGNLKTASGLESVQFRELELASGLRDAEFLKIVRKIVDVDRILECWPISLHDALLSTLKCLGDEPTSALPDLYAHPDSQADVYTFVEACSEYDLAFADWRFHHVRVVERVIGDLSPGTAGSSGSGYLSRTLRYRFFPELWDARNRLNSHSSASV